MSGKESLSMLNKDTDVYSLDVKLAFLGECRGREGLHHPARADSSEKGTTTEIHLSVKGRVRGQSRSRNKCC